uniref:Pentraxin family member n=1 Tax=Oryzias latipes TaxID=8090 RepID=A0A3P9J1B2_ORYLA
MRLYAFLFLISVPFIVEGDRSTQTVIFPTQTSTSYVEMTPKKDMTLRAFTLCLQVATELSGEREIILFAYGKRDDELNVWREQNGGISLYLGESSNGATFNVPDPGALHTHLCLTWDSMTGASTVFMNGRRSLTKVYKKGHTIPAGGKVILGQDPDNIEKMEAGFDAKQSLVGEIFDVNLWDFVLSDSDILDLYSGKKVQRGNIFDWETTNLRVSGNTVVLKHQV